MSYPNTDRLRALTHQLLDTFNKPYPSFDQSQDSISPIFHNLPWLPTPPMMPPPLEPVELPGSTPAFELPGSWSPPLKQDQSDSESNKNIYADIWLTETPSENPPPYSVLPPSPALSVMTVSSNESNSTMYSAKSHLSQPSRISQRSMELRPPRTSRSLKRKQAPQDLTLRQLRAKQSEAALRKMYEQQTDEYLEELFAMLGSPIQRPLSAVREQ
ncbi:hypothetical protein FKW77_007369 [Venturia effusa]|uniref:Uncharacterized protein n=1 Tax=Venturia effusa TaxID=50376 RepID=A0A517L7L5_9PEZI|nr:hypothetical protein FKW77_007369 [Venturia effusa]